MPLTKQYLRYSPSGTFNIIASPGCNSVWTTLRAEDGRFVATGTCESITIWDMQLGEKAMVLSEAKSEATKLVGCPTKKFLAAGFKDGSVKTYDVQAGEVVAVFSGHKSSITCLTYDSNGHRLASGSRDTEIVVWDVVAECGICRLSGHTGPLTDIAFLPTSNVLLSSSQDTSVKFWDLDTNYCFKTLLGHRTEVWSMLLMGEGEFVVTGTGDSEMRVWRLQRQDIKMEEQVVGLENDEENEDDSLSPLKSIKAGSVLRAGTGRVTGMTQCQGKVLATHGAADTLELFHFRSHTEAVKSMRKRMRKERKKAGVDEPAEENSSDMPELRDIVRRLPVIKTKGKIKSAGLVLGRGTKLRVALTLNNNTIEVYGMDIAASDSQPSLIRRIAQQGHHSETRSLAFSSDNLAIASGAGDSVKLWNRASLACLRTVPTGYVVSLVFVPGDRHVLAGTKEGNILVIDVSVGEVIEDIAAHETEVWAISLLPDQRGCVTGSGDSTVKFWDFELISTDKDNGKVLSLLHKRTLTLEEPVLAVKVAPDHKLIAVALLDMTIKVFFVDTLKFFLSLYGHKLPVTTIDISYDSTLLVSGSGDRNIKLWGLNYGDCHKSIFAHDASVTTVQFVPETHYFFTCGKDGKIKQWDADNYQKIITFKGHFGECWTLAVSPNGDHVVSSGSDRVLRMLTKTEEPLVLEDEAEEERAREEEEQLVTGPDSTVKGQGDLNLPTRKTVNSERGAEQLIECLEVSKEYQNALEDYVEGGKVGQPPAIPPLMLAYQCPDPDDYLVEMIRRIRSSDLEEALILLPFSFACELLSRLPGLYKREKEIELVTRTLTFLLRVHHKPIVGSKDLLPVLRKVQKLASKQVGALRDVIGCNYYGLQLLQRDIEQRQGVQLFRDATIERKEKTKKKKRKAAALQRAVLSIK